jgi:hypothetical protein
LNGEGGCHGGLCRPISSRVLGLDALTVHKDRDVIDDVGFGREALGSAIRPNLEVVLAVSTANLEYRLIV